MWQNIELSDNSCGRKKMGKNDISFRYSEKKKSYGVTLNSFLNKDIEAGGFFYFGLMRETESGIVAIILQKKPSNTNIKMHGPNNEKGTSGYSFNYNICSKKAVRQVYEALGLPFNDNTLYLKISDNKSKNDNCMLFELEIPSDDIYSKIK